jgi:hypothetical protein
VAEQDGVLRGDDASEVLPHHMSNSVTNLSGRSATPSSDNNS